MTATTPPHDEGTIKKIAVGCLFTIGSLLLFVAGVAFTTVTYIPNVHTDDTQVVSFSVILLALFGAGIVLIYGAMKLTRNPVRVF